jgi:Skp family chaperone for outer membrane proteins
MASADLKVAIIDLSKAFDSYYKTKDAQARLTEKVEQAQKDLSDLDADYEHMAQDAQKLHDASVDPTLSAQARAEKAAALQAKQQDLMAMQQKLQETKVEREREIDDERMRRHKEILDEITKLVTDYAGPQGFDLVIDKSGISANSASSLILYNSSKLVDITDEIVRQLNANAPPPTAGAPSGAAPSGVAPVPASH